MHDVWFTSDSHFSHKNILKYENRPFANTEEMDEMLIHNWNSVVKPNDLIFHLGDIFFCKADRMREIASRLNGRKILIRGNHDKDSNGKYNKLGFAVYDYYFYKDFILSHKPMQESALRVAIEQDLLIGNICGHLHSDGANLPRDVYKCVSVELTDYKPINFFDIVGSIKLNQMLSNVYEFGYEL